MFDVFQIPFMQQALVATVLVGVTCAFLSVFVVLRRIVFVGVALAQLSSAGVALALFLGVTAGFALTGASLAFMLVGVVFFALPTVGRRVSQEAVIGTGYAAAAALGILLVARSAAGESHMLNLLFGNILAATPKDNLLMAIVFACVGLVHHRFHKEFIFVSFDPEMARTLGVRTRGWDLLLFLTVGVTIAVAIRVAGALLVFAFLVIPGLTGLLAGGKLGRAFLVSIGAAVISAVAGLHLSFIFDLPSAATMIVLACAVLGITAVFGRRSS
jgi:ABC-type Mn2+/Zn2+ transport system permease subunit